jgi:phosphatidylserine/phosphatidylglycerophosphate/cardiolipin synthase-like enzyme
MRVFLPFAVALAGCVANPSDQPTSSGSGAADGSGSTTCGPSARLQAIIDATRDVIDLGTVSPERYLSLRNAGDPTVLIDGPQIFPAFREAIASAQHEVDLQTYVWEVGSDPANEILAGLSELARRRAVDAPDAPPVIVRFLFDASTLNFGSRVDTLPLMWASVDALALDPKHVQFELAGFYHLAMGNLHVKTLVVDGERAIVTGANPQAHHNYAQPWRDAGYKLAGEVALSLRDDFASAWQLGQLWTCGATNNPDFLRCSAPTEPLAALVPASLPAGACAPMLVVTRQADANPLSNRIDNTQDQAFIAAFASATDHIRMQTPNLNDDAAKAALVAAIERGVHVEIVLSKSFNDDSEVAPGQGGTNDDNVAKLYATLAADHVANACELLKIHWYSQDGGLTAVEGNGIYASHAKYTSIDDALVIVGTANMDTQSWNNSREVNVVVDSTQLARSWDEQLFLPDFDGGIGVETCP